MIRKSFSADVKALDESKGIVEAIVNVGAVLDLQDDVMEPGCWDDVLKAMRAGEMSWPSICWGHDWKDVRGKVLDAEVIPAGSSRLPARVQKAGGFALRVVGQYNMETEAGRDAFSNVKGGYVSQWSVGFEPASDGTRFEKGVRLISKVARWPEVSNVLLGASPGTATVAAKSAEAEERPAVSERQMRSADRLGAALRLAATFKADQSTKPQREDAKHKMRGTDGEVKFPIDDCSDASDAWALRGHADNVEGGQAAVERHVRSAAKDLGCKGPWDEDDGGKAHQSGGVVEPGQLYTVGELGPETLVSAELKDGRVPTLQGEESAHNKPVAAILDQLEALIGQELAEDEPEFDCVIRLAAIALDLIAWAQGEASEYDTDYAAPIAMSAALRAGIVKLAEPVVAPPTAAGATSTEDAETELPEWIRAALESYEAAPEPPQHSVPDDSGDWEQHMPDAVTFRFGRRGWSDTAPR